MVYGKEMNNTKERGGIGERERENLNLNLNLNLFLFYNGYKLGRMPLFIWPLIQNYNLSQQKISE